MSKLSSCLLLASTLVALGVPTAGFPWADLGTWMAGVLLGAGLLAMLVEFAVQEGET